MIKTLKKKFKKGEYGYLQYNKVRQLLITLLLLFIVAIIFYTGIIIYHNTKNFFTVIATVSVIPTAKFAVSYLMIMKHKSCDLKLFEKSLKSASDSIVLADLLLSSTEKIIPIKIAVINDNSTYLLSELEVDKIKKSETYIREFLETEAKVSSVRIFNNEEKFVKAIKTLNKNNTGKFDDVIKKLLLIYSL